MRYPSGRDYKLLIAVPDEPAPSTGFAVIYLLDPGSSFATLVETTRLRAIELRPFAIVGIEAAEAGGARPRYFTPPTDRSTLPLDNFGVKWGENGGADAFLGFIQEDVKAAVRRRIPVDATREALFGHSLGGLFALHALFMAPASFKTYVAASPSLWWGNRAIFEEARRFLHRKEARAAPRLLLTVGALEEQVQPGDERWLRRSVPSAELAAMRERYEALIAANAQVTNCRQL